MFLFEKRKGASCLFLLISLIIFVFPAPSSAEKKKTAEELFNEAREQYDKAQYVNALELYNKALELKPKLAEAYYGRGATYAMLGDIELALKDFDTILELDPADNDAYYNKAFTYEVWGMWEEAIENYKLFIDKAFFQTPPSLIETAKRKIRKLEYKLQGSKPVKKESTE
jgi:tetratricopeptide (TPR) repeat protein